MKNSPFSSKAIYLDTSSSQKYRGFSKSPKSTSHFSIPQTPQTGSSNNHYKQICIISNLRNELGTIKNEVTRLISKGHGSAVSQEKKCNRMERAREDYATKSSSINENCASFESKNPENEEELKKLSTYLDKIKIELKETLNRQTIVINQKAHLLENMALLKKEKKQAQAKLQKLLQQYKEVQSINSQLNLRLKSASIQNDNLQKQLSQLKYSYELSVVSNNQKQLIIKRLKEEQKQLKQTLGKMEIEISKQKENNRTMEKKIFLSESKWLYQLNTLNEKYESEKLQLQQKNAYFSHLIKKQQQNESKTTPVELKQISKQKDKKIHYLTNEIKFLEKDIKSLLNWRDQSEIMNTILNKLNEQIILDNLSKLNKKYQEREDMNS